MSGRRCEDQLQRLHRNPEEQRPAMVASQLHSWKLRVAAEQSSRLRSSGNTTVSARGARGRFLAIDHVGMWPPSSPDFNPLDYYVWNAVSRMACTSSHANIDELKSAAEAAWYEQEPEDIKHACKSFRRRIQAVYDADGGYVE